MIKVNLEFTLNDDFLEEEYEEYVEDGGEDCYEDFQDNWLADADVDDLYRYDGIPEYDYRYC